MKRLYIIVEGQTEQEFVRSLLAPYLMERKILSVTPILIHTSKMGKGGFVNYAHLRNDAKRLLSSMKGDLIVSTFIDFFRCPEVPFKERWQKLSNHYEQVTEMEKCIAEDINDHRFIPYIQLHEFEALLFSSNAGFEEYFSSQEQERTAAIVHAYPNPEDINSSPSQAPSKRLLSIHPNYDKILEGNLIALCVGMETMLEKCPRFKTWTEKLIAACR